MQEFRSNLSFFWIRFIYQTEKGREYKCPARSRMGAAALLTLLKFQKVIDRLFCDVIWRGPIRVHAAHAARVWYFIRFA